MKSSTSVVVTGGLLVSLISHAGPGASKVGRAIDHAATETGKTIRHAAKETARTLEHGAKETGRTIKHGAEETAKAIEKYHKELGVAYHGLSMAAQAARKQTPRLGPLHCTGRHQCWTTQRIGHWCRVEGRDFLDRQEAYFRLKQDDCCKYYVWEGAQLTDRISIKFSFEGCSQVY